MYIFDDHLYFLDVRIISPVNSRSLAQPLLQEKDPIHKTNVTYEVIYQNVAVVTSTYVYDQIENTTVSDKILRVVG